MEGALKVFKEVPGIVWLGIAGLLAYVLMSVGTQQIIDLTNNIDDKLQVLAVPISPLFYTWGAWHLRIPKYRMLGWEWIGGTLLSDIVIYIWPHVFPHIIHQLPKFNLMVDHAFSALG